MADKLKEKSQFVSRMHGKIDRPQANPNIHPHYNAHTVATTFIHYASIHPAHREP